MERKVLIGVVTDEFARRADFYDFFHLLEKPQGTYQYFSHDNPASGRNKIVQAARDAGCTDILFVDDDMMMRPEALKQLLEHDKDIVTGLYLQRAHPHRPLIFDEVGDNGEALYSYLEGDEPRLKEIKNAGMGFVLIKMSVFDKLEKPYFRLGELDPEQWCDDIGFFNRVTKTGVKMYCDMECLVGHIGTVAIWPIRNKDGWHIGYATSGDVAVSFPWTTPNLRYEFK
jgi:hypothetical protein